MLFQSFEFLLLLLVVLGLLHVLRRRASQHSMLLAASYVFYGWWDVRFLFLLLLSTVVDYTAALGINGVRLNWRQRWRMSVILLAAGFLCLGVNWSSVFEAWHTSSLTAFEWRPTWNGWREVLGMVMLFTCAGPFLYEVYQHLAPSARRTAFLVTSLATNLGILGAFKYGNFFLDNLQGFGGWLGHSWHLPAWHVILPVGISFYTFQTMSYTIDVYRGQLEAERSLLRVALYVAYFPQLVAGPILRPQQFLPALRVPWTLEAANLQSGFHLALVGLCKKVLIADSVSGMVDAILGNPQGQPSLLVIFATLLFAVQIYCDFSGYTDIARGISRMFGVEIPLNFNYPYFSTSIIEFWRRWHISLSTWLRDYLYIPLGGNRLGSSRTYTNLLITMILGGLWHGASWNFVLWGAYQGVLLCLNRILRAFVERVPGLQRFLESRFGTLLRWCVTTYLVMLGWLIFRVTSWPDLVAALRAFVVFDGRLQATALGLGNTAPVLALLALLVFAMLHTFGHFVRRWPELLDATPKPILAILYFLIGMVLFYGWPGANEPFIYFQF